MYQVSILFALRNIFLFPVVFLLFVCFLLKLMNQSNR